ncbi:MAG: adenylate/guanylate cyclase domain-containing protein [Betaproteobacteria bacterium]
MSAVPSGLVLDIDLLDTLPVGVLALEADGKVRICNAAAAETLRLDRSNIQGRRLMEFLSELNLWVLEVFEEAARTQSLVETTEQELYVEHTDEWILVDLKCLPMALSKGASRPVHLMVLLNREKEASTRRLMARYMSDDLMDLLGADTAQRRLGGTSQFVSTLFSDIRDFTRLTEALGPSQTVSMLNEYFSYVEDVISNRSGSVDKYIGDAVMAVFGLARESPEDADNAVQAACDMRLVLAMLNERRLEEGKEVLRIGVGVASGQVIAGNIGSPRRMDYTVIGDPVNLAARLEAITKAYGSMVIICGHTRARLRTVRTLRRLDRFAVFGQDQATDAYEVLDHHQELARSTTDVAQDRIIQYEEALGLYLEGNWTRALSGFEKVEALYSGDRAPVLMAQRCRNFIESPPQRWSGYTRLDGK